MKPWLFSLLLAVPTFAATGAGALEDGAYVMRESHGKSEMKTTGNLPVEIERKLNPGEFRLTVRSFSNWNDKFEISYADDLDQRDISHIVGLAVNGKMTIDAGNIHVFPTVDRKTAERIAGLVGDKPTLRRHPGHQLAVRFKTDKNSYFAGAPIKVSVSIQNVGDKIVAFREEAVTGKNLSGNLAFSWNGNDAMKPIATTDRDVASFIGRIVKIKPGETIVLREENFLKWYILKTSGFYGFVGSYQMEYYDLKAGERDDPIWTEWLSEQFVFYLQ